MRIRTVAGLLAVAALTFPTASHASSSTSVVDQAIAIVNQVIESSPIDPTGPVAPSGRQWVLHSITITGTAGGINAVNTFPSPLWSCYDSMGMSSYTVSCVPQVDNYTCYVMPVEAQSLAAGTTVNGTVTCGTNSLSTGYTTWPSPAVSASSTLGNAPIVSCTADWGDAISPLDPVLDALRPVIALPRDPESTLRSVAEFQVTCGPDPKV